MGRLLFLAPVHPWQGGSSRWADTRRPAAGAGSAWLGGMWTGCGPHSSSCRWVSKA